MLPPEGEEEKTQAYYVIKVSLMDLQASLVAQMVNYPSAMQETRLQSLGWEYPLEKGMAISSNMLAWRIPQTEEPGGLQSLGSQRVGYDWATSTSTSNGFTVVVKWVSIQFRHSVVSDSVTPWTAACQAYLSITNSWSSPKPMSTDPVSHPTISSSVVPFSSCPQFFPASGSFQMSQLFASGGQSIGVSASTSPLPMNNQDWSLGWTGWISLQSKGLSRVFSNTTVQKHQIFSAQLSL